MADDDYEIVWRPTSERRRPLGVPAEPQPGDRIFTCSHGRGITDMAQVAFWELEPARRDVNVLSEDGVTRESVVVRFVALCLRCSPRPATAFVDEAVLQKIEGFIVVPDGEAGA